MSERFEVVCTDRGQHGRLVLAVLLRDPEGLEEHLVRAAPFKGAVPSDETRGSFIPATRKYVVAPSSRDDFAGRTRFRFTCRACGRDVPWSLTTALAVVDGCLASGRRVVDISLLP